MCPIEMNQDKIEYFDRSTITLLEWILRLSGFNGLDELRASPRQFKLSNPIVKFLLSIITDHNVLRGLITRIDFVLESKKRQTDQIAENLKRSNVFAMVDKEKAKSLELIKELDQSVFSGELGGMCEGLIDKVSNLENGFWFDFEHLTDISVQLNSIITTALVRVDRIKSDKSSSGTVSVPNDLLNYLSKLDDLLSKIRNLTETMINGYNGLVEFVKQKVELDELRIDCCKRLIDLNDKNFSIISAERICRRKVQNEDTKSKRTFNEDELCAIVKKIEEFVKENSITGSLAVESTIRELSDLINECKSVNSKLTK
ncbi:hypothetical protein ACOME3_001572 [Neoechinorhynchus agilis]